MLRRAGVEVRRSGRTVTLTPPDAVELPDTEVPADTSAAAPFLVGATLLRDSLLRLPGVLLNPGRTGLLDQMERMGARIGVAARREHQGEPVADLEVTHADLTRAFLPEEDVARSIDELPLLGLLFQFCRGESVVKGAGELRVKESDRITSVVNALRAIGIAAEERRDGFVVRGSGSRPDGGVIDAEGDHRIAMLGGIAGLVSRSGVTVRGAECVDVSFPGFFEVLEALAHRP
jgi:3-phosphoshikimate 1-carboxyvinyltransferase